MWGQERDTAGRWGQRGAVGTPGAAGTWRTRGDRGLHHDRSDTSSPLYMVPPGSALPPRAARARLRHCFLSSRRLCDSGGGTWRRGGPRSRRLPGRFTAQRWRRESGRRAVVAPAPGGPRARPSWSGPRPSRPARTSSSKVPTAACQIGSHKGAIRGGGCQIGCCGGGAIRGGGLPDRQPCRRQSEEQAAV